MKQKLKLAGNWIEHRITAISRGFQMNRKVNAHSDDKTNEEDVPFVRELASSCIELVLSYNTCLEETKVQTVPTANT